MTSTLRNQSRALFACCSSATDLTCVTLSLERRQEPFLLFGKSYRKIDGDINFVKSTFHSISLGPILLLKDTTQLVRIGFPRFGLALVNS